MNVLRTKLLGADAGLVASLAGVSVGHARRCLSRLASQGLVETVDPQLGPRRRGTAPPRLWRLAAAAAWCIEELPALAAARPREGGDRIPAEFWDCFWSGTPARELRISTDGLYIAEALINGRDPHARAWALNALPVETLRECRKLRGCDTGTPRRWLDCAIRERSGA